MKWVHSLSGWEAQARHPHIPMCTRMYVHTGTCSTCCTSVDSITITRHSITPSLMEWYMYIPLSLPPSFPPPLSLPPLSLLSLPSTPRLLRELRERYLQASSPLELPREVRGRVKVGEASGRFSLSQLERLQRVLVQGLREYW